MLERCDKRWRQQVVPTVDQIHDKLQDQKLVWSTTIKPGVVGCHMVNRRGIGLSPSEVHSISTDIVPVAYFCAVCVHTVCVEDGRWTEKLCKMSPHMAPMSRASVTVSSLVRALTRMLSLRLHQHWQSMVVCLQRISEGPAFQRGCASWCHTRSMQLRPWSVQSRSFRYACASRNDGKRDGRRRGED